ncbi:hypothetical protein QQ045_033571 [Rhodiola kirilowii]
MDSGASRFILSPANFHSLCYSGINEESAIDLGLSLRTMPLQPPHQPDSQLLAGSYEVCQHVNRFSQMKSLMIESSRQDKTVKNDNDEEEEAGTWGRERWTYVKVNMDGVIVGRKICILDHGGYSSLALQLEDMFGSKSVSGLRLLQAESEFSLFYKDIKENWRTIGDVSWK